MGRDHLRAGKRAKFRKYHDKQEYKTTAGIFSSDLLKIGCRQLAFKVPDSTHGVPLITQKCLMSPSVWIQTVQYRNGSNKFSTWTSLPTLKRRDKLQGGVERNYVSKNDYPFSQLKEEELEEEFVRGSGPGGQSVNQTANCVVLKHLPTGIVVKCHETRSLQQNRRRARERLQERVDLHLNGNNSFLALNQEEASRRRHEKKKKNKFRLKLKKAFKEREGID